MPLFCTFALFAFCFGSKVTGVYHASFLETLRDCIHVLLQCVVYFTFFIENGGGVMDLVYGSSPSSYMDCKLLPYGSQPSRWGHPCGVEASLSSIGTKVSCHHLGQVYWSVSWLGLEPLSAASLRARSLRVCFQVVLAESVSFGFP